MARDEIEKIMDRLDGMTQHISGVGSDVKRLQKDFYTHSDLAKEHWKVNSAFQAEAQPLLDALRFVQTFQRFLKWGGLSVGAFFAALYWLIHR